MNTHTRDAGTGMPPLDGNGRSNNGIAIRVRAFAIRRHTQLNREHMWWRQIYNIRSFALSGVRNLADNTRAIHTARRRNMICVGRGRLSVVAIIAYRQHAGENHVRPPSQCSGLTPRMRCLFYVFEHGGG